jgi:hypothetical protein
MTRPSATCELWVNGTRVADKGTDIGAGTATALSALAVRWGRDGQNEQPGPASCNFEILDPAGGDSALDYLHVGSTVAVWAEGHIPNLPTDPTFVQTMDDGTFDTYPLGDAAGIYFGVSSSNGSNAYLSVNVISEPGRGAIGHLFERAAGSGSNWSIVVPPRKFSPVGQLPNAWDDIPKAQTSDPAWRISANIRGPVGAALTLYPVSFSSPYSTAYLFSGTGRVAVVGTGNWQAVTTDVKPQVIAAGGRWIGFMVSIDNSQDGRWNKQTGDWQSQGAETWAAQFVPYVDVDNAFIGHPSTATPIRRVLTFSGQVSDLAMEPYGDGGTVLVKATAMDLGAQLANKVIGDTPWAVQTLATRADRIAQLAGVTSSPRVRMDAALSGLASVLPGC